ncbi:ATP dependent DNA ligase [Nocardia goodfellowii]
MIAGWSPGTGVRAGRIGSLAVAVPDPEGNLVYAGHVGTGFSAAALASLYTRLRPLHRISPVLDHARAGSGVVWVVPELVGEVAFTEWTSENRLRHPSWRGLRPDKPLWQIKLRIWRPEWLWCSPETSAHAEYCAFARP